MSNKNKEFEDEFFEYDETDDFSVYDISLEESVIESRRARREAKQRRKVKSAKVVTLNEEPPFQPHNDDTIKIKSKRKKRNKSGKKVKVVTAHVPYEGKRKKKKKKKGCLHRLFSLCVVLLVLYALAVAGSVIWSYFDADTGTDWLDKPVTPIKDIADSTKEFVVGEVPDRTVVLLMVTDEDKTRTDTMILANYDNVNKRLSLMSIPRDIIVEVSDEAYRTMRSEYPEPGKPQMKMTEIHHFGGENHGVELLLEQIDSMFDVKPDYTVKVDFEAFNYIVDSIGGVEFDVPRDMDYEDPTQDLYIHLKKGVQVLDGDKAEQLVRFRKDNYGGGYANGDIERIAVQQEFIKAFMKKALSSDAVFKNVLSYMSAFNKYVITDATINDMARYAMVLKDIDMNNVTTITLPSIPSSAYGITGYEVLEDEAERTIYNIFKKPLDEITAEIELEKAEAHLEKSNDKIIRVLNGGYTNGMAREIEARLWEKEIPVESVGTYDGEKSDDTIIYVSREGIGLDLVKFFYNTANVVVDTTKTTDEGYDIVVVVGINEPMEKGGQPITNEYQDEEPHIIEDTEGDYAEDYYYMEEE